MPNLDEVSQSDERIPMGADVPSLPRNQDSILTTIRIKAYNAIDYVRDDSYVKVLLAILFFGAVLRYYGLHNAENTDEYNEVFEALRVASGKFNTNRWHKKGFQNILAVEYGVYFIIGYLTNLFSSPMDFAAKIIRNMDPLFLIGRYTVATMGTISIALLYLIGKSLYNKTVGLIAAAFLTVNTLHVWTSHLVGTDVPLTFFFLLSFYFIVRFFQSGRLSDYAIAAFLGAVTINIKIIGGGIGIIFLMAHFFRCYQERKSIRRSIFSREILYSTAAFTAGLLISNPAIIVAFKQWVMYFVWQYGIYTNVYDEVSYAVGGNAYYTYLMVLKRDFGLPLFLLTACGLFYAVYRRERWDTILLTFVIVIFLVLANSDFLIMDRYLMTLFPALFLLSGRLLDVAIKRFVSDQRLQATAIAVVCIVMMLYPFRNSAAYTVRLTEDNTSKVSKKWIEENIPAGSKILIDAGHTMITSGPRISQSREKLEAQMNVIRNLKEGETFDSPQVKIVDSYASIYFELLLQNMPEITYDITTTELGREVESFDYYRENGFDYIIHNASLRSWLEDPAWREKYPKSAEFYENLDQQFSFVQSFEPTATRSGDTIKIYKVK